MTRAVFYLILAATLANSPGAWDKSDSSQSAAVGPSAGGSGGGWKNLAATARAKFFTPEVSALPGPGTPKTRTATSCTVETPGGSQTATFRSYSSWWRATCERSGMYGFLAVTRTTAMLLVK